MRRSFKYRLYPNKATEQKLIWVLDRCRELYNAGLSERKDAWKYEQKRIECYDQINDLPEIKQDIRPEYQEIIAHVLQDVLRRLDKAFANFFRRCKEGAKEPGFPRFQGKNRYDSFTYPSRAGWKFDGYHLHLARIGSIKVRLSRPIEGKVKTVTIKREVDQWFVIFACEVETPQKLPVSYEDVGIDLGVMRLATLSNGEMIEHPRYLKKADKKLEKAQQSLSKKKRGSHRRNKARKLVAKVHRKIARQRRDFLHKQSKKLVDRYQVIVFEDLQAANMTKRPKPKQDEVTGEYLSNHASQKSGLNKSILDAGWAMFVEMTQVKAECAGRNVLMVNPYKTSQRCSNEQCGKEIKKDLSVRVHTCPHCGLSIDRDINAAINILRLGMVASAGVQPTQQCVK
jgi:putative transposase